MRYSNEHLEFLESATDEMEALPLDESDGAELEAARAATAATATLQEKICGVYSKVRPFLQLVGNLFFIPAKWKTAINGFIQTMDLVCPAG